MDLKVSRKEELRTESKGPRVRMETGHETRAPINEAQSEETNHRNGLELSIRTAEAQAL